MREVKRITVEEFNKELGGLRGNPLPPYAEAYALCDSQSIRCLAAVIPGILLNGKRQYELEGLFVIRTVSEDECLNLLSECLKNVHGEVTMSGCLAHGYYPAWLTRSGFRTVGFDKNTGRTLMYREVL